MPSKYSYHKDNHHFHKNTEWTPYDEAESLEKENEELRKKAIAWDKFVEEVLKQKDMNKKKAQAWDQMRKSVEHPSNNGWKIYYDDIRANMEIIEKELGI